MKGSRITGVDALEILDSRGNPTVKATVYLEGGAQGSACVPSGASTGKYEACELRDGESRYGGKGVTRAVENVRGEIAKALSGMDAEQTEQIDRVLCALDGTPNKSRLGANATLAASLAALRAAAAARELPVWRLLGGSTAARLPVPMMNVLNGGAHAANTLDVQEFMIMPVGAPSFREGIRWCSEIYHTLRELLRQDGYSVGVGDEGGYAPDLPDNRAALEYLMRAVDRAGYREGVKLALDVAASEWAENGGYRMPKAGTVLDVEGMIAIYTDWTAAYPILSIEDGLGEEDFAGWQKMTRVLPDTMLVGDDLFVTNAARLGQGIAEGAGNAILIKPNQIGTVTETVRVIALARQNGYRVILSHRSGETEDPIISDLAVGLGADFIKSGAPCRSERVAKYNRLLELEKELIFAPPVPSTVLRAPGVHT